MIFLYFSPYITFSLSLISKTLTFLHTHFHLFSLFFSFSLTSIFSPLFFLLNSLSVSHKLNLSQSSFLSLFPLMFLLFTHSMFLFFFSIFTSFFTHFLSSLVLSSLYYYLFLFRHCLFFHTLAF